MECVKVDTHLTGEIDCDDFKAKISRNKDKPAIVNVNIGEFLLLLLPLTQMLLCTLPVTPSFC